MSSSEEEHYSDEDHYSTSSSDKENMTTTTSSSSSEEEDLSDVELSFETYNMDRERDFHSIKEFIKKIFGSGLERLCGGQVGKVDHSIITSIIVDCLSEYIGSTSKSSEDESPLSFTSMIPFNLNPTLLGSTSSIGTHSKGRKYDPEDSTYSKRQVQLNLLFEMLVQRLPFKNINREQKKLLSELKREDVSLFLHYRFSNLPSQLSLPLMRQLMDDVSKATKEDDPSFESKYLLVLTPTFLHVPRQGSIDSSSSDDEEDDNTNANPSNNRIDEIKSKNNNAPKKRKGNPNPVVLKEEEIPFNFLFEEFELLAKYAICFWDFKTQNLAHESTDSQSTFTKDGLAMYSRVFLVERDSFLKFISEAEDYINA